MADIPDEYPGSVRKDAANAITSVMVDIPDEYPGGRAQPARRPSAVSVQTLYIPIASPPTPVASPRHTPTTLSAAYTYPPSPALFDFGTLDTSERRAYLASLLAQCTPAELLFVSSAIAPRLKRDFLRDLPVELALLVLRCVDDVPSLARAAQVSRAWRALLRDEGVWRRMCRLHGFCGEGGAEDEDGPLGAMDRASRPRARIPPEAADPAFTFRRHFRAEYTAMTNWRRGGRLLRAHRVHLHRPANPLASPALGAVSSPDQGVVTAVALDAEWVVVGLANARIHVFSARSGVLARTLVGHASGVWAVWLVSESAEAGEAGAERPADVCAASDGWGQGNALVVSGGCDKTVKVWDVKSGSCLHTLAGHTSTIRCIKVLHARPLAVSGARDCTLRVWDVSAGAQLRVLAGHEGSVRCLDVCGNRVVSGSYDCTARLWDVDTGECLHVLRGHFSQLYAVAFDGVRVATGGLDTSVRVWDAETGECLALLQGHTALVCQLQLSPSLLATGGSDGRVITFALGAGGRFAARHRIAAHDSSVTALQCDGRWLVTGGVDGRVRLFETGTGNYVRELSEPCESVWKVAYRRDTLVVTCKRAGKTVMEIWSFRPREEGRRVS